MYLNHLWPAVTNGPPHNETGTSMKRPYDKILPIRPSGPPHIIQPVGTCTPEALRNEMDRVPRRPNDSWVIARYRGQLTFADSKHSEDVFKPGKKHLFTSDAQSDEIEQVLRWCIENEYLLNAVHIVNSLQLRHLFFDGQVGFLAKIWSSCESLRHVHLRRLDLGESCSHADLEWVASERLLTLTFHGDMCGSDFSRRTFAESLGHTRGLERLAVHHAPASFIDWATENEIPLPIWVTSSLHSDEIRTLAELQELRARNKLLDKFTLTDLSVKNLKLMPMFCQQVGRKFPISLVLHTTQKGPGGTKVFDFIKQMLEVDALIELTLSGEAFHQPPKDYDEKKLVEAVQRARKLRILDLPWTRKSDTSSNIMMLLNGRKQPESRFGSLLRPQSAIQGFARSTGLSPQIANQLTHALGDDFDGRSLACVNRATNDSSMRWRAAALRHQLKPTFAALSRQSAPGTLSDQNLVRTIGETANCVTSTISRYERSDHARSHLLSDVRQLIPMAGLWKRIKSLSKVSPQTEKHLRILSALANHCDSRIPDAATLAPDAQDVRLYKHDLDSISRLLSSKPEIWRLAASLSRGSDMAGFSSALGNAHKLESLHIEYSAAHELVKTVGDVCNSGLSALSLIPIPDDHHVPLASASDWTALMKRLCNLRQLDVSIPRLTAGNKTEAIEFLTALVSLRSLSDLTLRAAGDDLALSINALAQRSGNRSLTTLGLICTDTATTAMMHALGEFIPTAPFLRSLHVLAKCKLDYRGNFVGSVIRNHSLIACGLPGNRYSQMSSTEWDILSHVQFNRVRQAKLVIKMASGASLGLLAANHLPLDIQVPLGTALERVGPRSVDALARTNRASWASAADARATVSKDLLHRTLAHATALARLQHVHVVGTRRSLTLDIIARDLHWAGALLLSLTRSRTISEEERQQLRSQIPLTQLWKLMVTSIGSDSAHAPGIEELEALIDCFPGESDV